MAKPKQRQSAHSRSNKNDDPDAEQIDQPAEDDWVIVKKQRVTILIPALPAFEQPIAINSGESPLQAQPSKAMNTPSSPVPIVLNCGESPRQAQPRKTINTQPSLVEEMHTEKHAVVQCEKSISLGHKHTVQTINVAPAPPQPTLHFPKPSRLSIGSENPPVCSFRSSKINGLCNVTKVSKQTMIIANGGSMINKRMRAFNLERRLQRAGGLTNWLVSLGLGHFIKIFQGKNVNKFQLANLTMEKLKDMGSFAVGPRRKLIHAIDCLCHP
nr:uncharacterized protein LOC109150529 [Ipomoea batatas]